MFNYQFLLPHVLREKIIFIPLWMFKVTSEGSFELVLGSFLFISVFVWKGLLL